MNKKKGILFAGILTFAFLLVCAVINFAGGRMGAGISSLGAGLFYLGLSWAANEKSKKDKQ